LIFQIVQIIGAVLILSAYGAHQMKHMNAEGTLYQTLNMFGGLFLCITAVADRQYGFIMLEGTWTIISAWGLWKVHQR
jgi:hypothetical protein